MEIEIENNGHYLTQNSALAAYLRVEGFTLLDVIPTDGVTPAVFYFEQDNKIRQYEHQWQVGQAICNVCQFFESYRLCLRMVRIGKL